MSCRRVRDWLHRDAASLDETQRLVLDDHLASCERCRADRDRLRVVREVGAALPVPPPGARAYQRAIARALLEGPRKGNPRRRVIPVLASRRTGMHRVGSGPARPSAPDAARRWLMPAGLGVAAAAAVAFVIAMRDGRDVASPTPPSPPTPLPVAVQTPPSPATPATPVPGTVHTPPAMPATSSPTPVPPSPTPATPPVPRDRIEDGALEVDGTRLASGAEVPAHARLRATTATRVQLGEVHVVIAAHSEVRWAPVEHLLLLDAGSVEVATKDPVRVQSAVAIVELEQATATIDAGAVAVKHGTARVLGRSRRVLAELGAGERWTAPGRKPTRADVAEAEMVRAERAQAAGELATATARYTAIAAHYRELPVAESALYAAARVEVQRGRIGAARALLTQYLERYPDGRFADDVRRQLSSATEDP